MRLMLSALLLFALLPWVNAAGITGISAIAWNGSEFLIGTSTGAW
ncbi:hypothetical protein [Candidatus Pyrohabitans sp.]